MLLLPSRYGFYLLCLGYFCFAFFCITESCDVGWAEEPPSSASESTVSELPAKVSFDREVRPILRASCQGCHQPAKKNGGLELVTFAGLRLGGESGPAVVAGDPEHSLLLEKIEPVGGVAEMPPAERSGPLSTDQRALIRRWIEQGAVDDSPASIHPAISPANPPIYSRLPLVTSLDVSPDGSLVAIAAFHEVVLQRADGSGIVSRLVGNSPRIERVRFSPDGTRLAIAGGTPGLAGEVQVWDLQSNTMTMSVSVGYDTIYGLSWSPDGQFLSAGTPENTVVAWDANTGQEKFVMRSHTDWVLDTVFSPKGDFLVSVGRDMTAKLTKMETQQFIDNITSITPGALKGGIQSVARHPKRDEILVGGADGVPQIYRMHRETARRIGDNANLIRKLPVVQGRIWSVAFSGSGDRCVSGSSLDGAGWIDIFKTEYVPELPAIVRTAYEKLDYERSEEEKKALDEYVTQGVERIVSIHVPESEIFAVAFSPDGRTVFAAGTDGLLRVYDATSGQLNHTVPTVPLQDSSHEALPATITPDYVRDVAPVMSRLGCNAGTCHGAKDGKNGFKLSLRGYDAIFDVRALKDDHASRRVNLAFADDSLMLLKATAAVPHQGGQVLLPQSAEYRLLRDWIVGGAKLNTQSRRPLKIELAPQNPTLSDAGSTQSFTVHATYEDGERRDVTRYAFIESGLADVATHDATGTLTALRRGEAPILARYEGCYAATTLTVMGPRDGFVWTTPETWCVVDQLVANKWERLKIEGAPLASDAEFLRRVYLDLTGLPPPPERVRAFLTDSTPTREKRDRVIDELIGSPEFVDYWSNKWADLLQVNGKFLGRAGATRLREWIKTQISANTPYDVFVREIVAANGSTHDSPPASYFKILRTPDAILENTTHLFLATRFNCNKCHDHPFERWTQDQYYETGAFFAGVKLAPDAEHSGSERIAGTAVDGETFLYEVVEETATDGLKHERTGQIVKPKFPFEVPNWKSQSLLPRQEFANWLTAPENRYFATSYINRLWGYLLGKGLIEPLDDIRAGNPASNPELLEYLSQEFVKSGFNVRAMLSLICKSRTYQLSIETNPWNHDDDRNYSHAMARRLPAEVLYDSVISVTGAKSEIPGAGAGTRAVQLSDGQIDVTSGFLGNLGRPPRESSCECERSSDVHLGSVMAMLNSPEVASAISDVKNDLASLVLRTEDNRTLVEEIYLRVLSRLPTAAELEMVFQNWAQIPHDHSKLIQQLAIDEAAWTVRRDQLEQARQQSILAAQAELGAYEPQRLMKLANAETERKQRIAEAEAKWKEADHGAAERAATWEQGIRTRDLATSWRALVASEVRANEGVTIQQSPNGIHTAKGAVGNADYTLEFPLAAQRITGISLEALADPSLPNFGPGLSGGGNFVVSEIRASLRDHAGGAKPLTFSQARADFEQEGFTAMNSINGKSERDDQGWAIGDKAGRPHSARFQLEVPIEVPAQSFLVVEILCRYGNGDHALGKFQVRATSSSDALEQGLPEEIVGVVLTPLSARTPEQTAVLKEYLLAHDDQLLALQQDIHRAQLPIPADEQYVALQAKLAKAQIPVPDDPVLVRHRGDAMASAEQLINQRLTAAQDLVWALINTPEFLFNH